MNDTFNTSLHISVWSLIYAASSLNAVREKLLQAISYVLHFRYLYIVLSY